MNNAMAELYKNNIENWPLHRNLGLRINHIAEWEASVTIPVNEQTWNPAGSLHGGVIYLVADVTAFAAVGPSLESNEFAVTIDAQSSIYRSTTDGQVTFTARVASKSKKVIFINVEAKSSKGKILAEARITKAIIDRVPENFQLQT